MNKYLNFELCKTKKNLLVVVATTFFLQIICLYFFTLIGRYEASGEDEILKDYGGLLGLATTITMCVFTIYGTIIVNRMIVSKYIGASRVRLYLYPCGRATLYYVKNIAFVVSFGLMYLIGMLVANVIYFIMESKFPILNSELHAMNYAMMFFITSITSTILTISMILISSFIGIVFSSQMKTMVTGLILIVSLGNMATMSFVNFEYITLMIAVCIMVMVFLGMKVIGKRIDQEDVF